MAKTSSDVAAVKAAKTKDELRAAVRKVMDHLTFQQRRQFLIKTRELAPITEPYLAQRS